MNDFEEAILLRVKTLLEGLKVPQDPPPDPEGYVIVVPDAPNSAVLRDVKIGVIEELPVPNPATPPTAFVSLDGGTNDSAEATFITHLVEVLDIRIQVHLDQKIGTANRPLYIESNPGPILPIDIQGTDLRTEIRKLITHADLMTAVAHLPEASITNVVQSEWEFDERYRGGPQEILTMIFQAVVTDTKQ